MKYTKENITRGAVGTISESLVIIDLFQKGYEVFKAINPTSSCDIIAFKNNKIYRIEVKTGHFNESGITWAKRYGHKKENYDILAIVIREENKIIYDPKIY